MAAQPCRRRRGPAHSDTADSAYPAPCWPPTIRHCCCTPWAWPVLAQDQPFTPPCAASRWWAAARPQRRGCSTHTSSGVRCARQAAASFPAWRWALMPQRTKGALADAPAHTLATVAVVGTGLDRVYPARHHALAQRIARQGLLLSEFPLGTQHWRTTFPNATASLPARHKARWWWKAALKSGSHHRPPGGRTGREVFCDPRLHPCPQVRGRHALIRQGATLVETVHDILQELPPQERPSAMPQPSTGPTTMAPPEHTAVTDDAQIPLLCALGWDPMGLTPCKRARAWTPPPAGTPAGIRISRAVARLTGGRFQRLARLTPS